MLARWTQALLVAVMLLTAVPLIALTDLQMRARQMATRDEIGELYYLPPKQVLRATALGYNELAADLVWLRTINYFADRLFSDRDFSHLQRYVDTALALDEHFEELYRFAPSMFTNRGRHNNASVLQAIALLRRAHQTFPQNHRYPFSIGAYYLTDLRPATPEQRKQWRRKGADWIRRAALIGADTPWLPALAARIYSEQGQRELAVRHLKEMYLTTQNPRTKKQIASKLRQLNAEHVASELSEQARALAKRVRESPIAFVGTDLLILIDMPGSPASSPQAQ